MQCPMQRKASSPTLKLAHQTAAGRQRTIQPAGVREKQNKSQKNRKTISHDSEITHTRWKGKKKNKLVQNKSNLPWFV